MCLSIEIVVVPSPFSQVMVFDLTMIVVVSVALANHDKVRFLWQGQQVFKEGTKKQLLHEVCKIVLRLRYEFFLTDFWHLLLLQWSLFFQQGRMNCLASSSTCMIIWIV